MYWSHLRAARGASRLVWVALVLLLGLGGVLAHKHLQIFVAQARLRQAHSSAEQVVRQISVQTLQEDEKPWDVASGEVQVGNVRVEKGADVSRFYMLNNKDRTKATYYACIVIPSDQDKPGGVGQVVLWAPIPKPLPVAEVGGKRGWDRKCL